MDKSIYIWYNFSGDNMKINNIKNLETALKEKSSEIEIYGDISNTVLKCGLLSNILSFCLILCFLSIASAIIFFILCLAVSLNWALTATVISICTLIFATTIILTLKFTQKAPVFLAVKLRGYTINKKNGRVILVRK